MDIEFSGIVVRPHSNDPNFYHREPTVHYLMLKANVDAKICWIWGPRICTYGNSISRTSTSRGTPMRTTRLSYFATRGSISNGMGFLVGLGPIRRVDDVVGARLQQHRGGDGGF
ncbi:CCR4-associated factor 1-like protein 11 [Pyrus ussuriensis x Pyrus communis]|uniref:CCR4-associated factor 1-like protein 11 n=1 Tax=Pyrus ussuriensis x Pyrus communis TaxID=2448454 RepID=A0A5N5I9V3_9ROSA|nr:CCR4-associated factor 1-like protein 11 [Pyrus ussuriensis x Pyrus communis]